jgi:hypothetical protein
MTPEKLAKIRAIAEDPRGHPNVRANAKRILDEHEPEPTFSDIKFDDAPRSPPHPNMYASDEYDRFRFMNLAQWGRSKNGNLIHTFTHKRVEYRMVLFAHKTKPTFGWLRIDTKKSDSVFSWMPYNTLAEAHRDAWEHLMRI